MKKNTMKEKTKILIVEDEEITALGLQALLQKEDYVVGGMVTSGESALKYLETNLVDCILMDILLDGEMDGISAAIRIYDQFHIPSIFLTAYGDVETFNRAKEAHPIGYLTKPILNIDHIKHTIEIGLSNFSKMVRTNPISHITQGKNSNQVNAVFKTEIRTDIETFESLYQEIGKRLNRDSPLKTTHKDESKSSELWEIDSKEKYTKIVRFFSILANKDRLKLLQYLSNMDATLEALKKIIQKKRTAILHHLALLEEAQYVTKKLQGKQTIFQISPPISKIVETIFIDFSSTTSKMLATICRSLGNEERVQILEMLVKQPQTVSELSMHIQKSQSNTSHHLNQLRKIEIVDTFKDGKESINKIDQKKWKIMMLLFQVFNPA